MSDQMNFQKTEPGATEAVHVEPRLTMFKTILMAIALAGTLCVSRNFFSSSENLPTSITSSETNFATPTPCATCCSDTMVAQFIWPQVKPPATQSGTNYCQAGSGVWLGTMYGPKWYDMTKTPPARVRTSA